MKTFIAFLLFAALAVVINGQTTSRPTRSTTTTRPRVTPTRQQGPPLRPVPSRAPTTLPPRPPQNPQTQTRQQPPVPTRTSQGPAVPTRSSPGPQPPTRPPPGNGGPPVPRPPVNPQNPDLPDGWPQAPTARPPPGGNEHLTSRPPRISVNGIPDPRCPMTMSDPMNRNPVQLPHESNCERFYKCDHGLAFEYQCPIGQHWNALRNYCDFPANANCGGNNPPLWNLPPNNNWNNNVPNLPPNNNWQNQPPNNNWNNQPNNNWPQQPPAVPLPEFIPPFQPNPPFQHPINIPMAPGK